MSSQLCPRQKRDIRKQNFFIISPNYIFFISITSYLMLQWLSFVCLLISLNWFIHPLPILYFCKIICQTPNTGSVGLFGWWFGLCYLWVIYVVKIASHAMSHSLKLAHKNRFEFFLRNGWKYGLSFLQAFLYYFFLYLKKL